MAESSSEVFSGFPTLQFASPAISVFSSVGSFFVS